MNIGTIGYYIVQETETDVEEVAFWNGDFIYLINRDEKRSLSQIFKIHNSSRFQIADLRKLQELNAENAALREANTNFDKRWRKYADDLEKEHEEVLAIHDRSLDYWTKKCYEESDKVVELQKKFDKLQADYDKLTANFDKMLGIAPVKPLAAG